MLLHSSCSRHKSFKHALWLVCAALQWSGIINSVWDCLTVQQVLVSVPIKALRRSALPFLLMMLPGVPAGDVWQLHPHQTDFLQQQTVNMQVVLPVHDVSWAMKKTCHMHRHYDNQHCSHIVDSTEVRGSLIAHCYLVASKQATVHF